MTERLFLVTPEAWGDAEEGDVVRVTGSEARHAVQVVRLGVGERVLVSDGAGRRSLGEIVSAQPTELVVRLGTLEHVPERSPRFVLVQALAKADRDEQAIEAATELGVDAVVPWQAYRSIVKWRGQRPDQGARVDKGARADKADKGRQRWVSVVSAAAKQARRPRVPMVAGLAGLAGVRELVAAAELALVLHEDASEPLAGVELPASGDVVVVVGPEGGISPEELETLAAAGARLVRLGPEVLRSGSAGPAALAVLNAASRWR